MPEVGRRPQQFNPIQHPRDNTDDLEARAAAAAARYARKTVSEVPIQTDPLTPKVVPPMPRIGGDEGD